MLEEPIYSFRGEVANVLDCNIEVSKFEFHPCD